MPDQDDAPDEPVTWNAAPIQNEIPLIGIVVPATLLLLYITVSSVLLPPIQFAALLSLVPSYIISPIGRWAIPFAIAIGFPWWYAGLTIFFLDFIGALFMAWNSAHLFSIPKLGPMMEKTVSRFEEQISCKPWIQRFSAITLLLYLTLPIHGAGAIMGSLIGRFLGIAPWRVFGIVVAGSAIGSCVMALGSSALKVMLIGNIAFGLAIIFILIFLAIAGYLGYRTLRRRRL